jgi:hypothetical protein
MRTLHKFFNTRTVFASIIEMLNLAADFDLTKNYLTKI